jgi:hypothetical protein
VDHSTPLDASTIPGNSGGMPTKTAARKAPARSKTAAPADDLPLYLTVPMVAKLAGRTPNAIRKLRDHGKGPAFVLVDGRLVAKRADVVAWLEGRKPQRAA